MKKGFGRRFVSTLVAMSFALMSIDIVAFAQDDIADEAFQEDVYQENAYQEDVCQENVYQENAFQEDVCQENAYQEIIIDEAAIYEYSGSEADYVELEEDYEYEAVGTSTVPTEKEAYNAMIAFKETYPEGTPYTNDNYYGWKGGYYSGGYGCAGFAFMLSDAAFGDLPVRKIENITYDQVHVGDILRVYNTTGGEHSVIILEKYDSYVVLAEGNYNSSVHWGRTLTAQQVTNAIYVFTRYPLGTFGETCTITFNANEGYGVIENQVVLKNQLSTLSTKVPERIDYTFVGWNTNKNSSEVLYKPGESYVFTGNTTLYAVWEEGFDDSMYPCQLQRMGLQIYEDGMVGLIMEFNTFENMGSYYYQVYLNGAYNPDFYERVSYKRDNEKGIMRFTFLMEAKELNDKVFVVMYGYNNRQCYAANQQSVLTYIKKAMNYSETTEEQKQVMIALLNYGSAAQEYFEYSTDNLANQILTEQEKQIVVDSSDYCSGYSIEGECDGLSYLGTSLILDYGFSLRHYFKLADGADANAYSFVNNGTDKNMEVLEGGMVAVTIDRWGIDDYTCTSTLVVSNGDSQVVIDYSIRSYVTLVYLNYSEGDSIYKLSTSIVAFWKAYYKAVSAYT